MKPPMLHTAYKVSYTRNAYGDYVTSTETTLKCHFREINQQVTDNNDETIQSDAMAWFEPDAGIDRKSIVRIQGMYYRVERIIKARKLHNSNVQFLKCELLKYGVIS